METKNKRAYNACKGIFFAKVLLCSSLMYFTSSCTKEDIEQVETSEEVTIIPKKFYKLLNNLSLDQNSVHYIESLDVIAHGDILYHADASISKDTTKEHWANRRVSWENSQNISYKIVGLNVDAHDDLIDHALQEWEDISPNIGFTRVNDANADTDLTITLQNTATFNNTNPSAIGSGAYATFPRNNSPGSNIYIREIELRRFNLPFVIKVLLVIHEVGHILGFTHPNQVYNGGTNIPCAGTREWHSNNTCGSLMNSTVNGCNWPNEATTIQQFREGANGWTLTDRYVIDWAYELAGENDPACN
ncbi:M57 family metalloprotease [Aquimarina sp. 2201CG1-2-11]|uniref:M57 family metalloprotease n=1 Tax=Aquimarina discodermiae TaxID=3231043 RepID=UPI003462BCA4